MALLPFSGGTFKVKIDTRANILALTPTSGKIAYATDTKRFLVADGTAWRSVAIPLGTPSTGTDIGVLPFEDDNGYGVLDLEGKNLQNTVVKSFDTNIRAAQEGAIKTTALLPTVNAVQVYINGAWRSLLAYSVAQEDAIMLWTDVWQTYDLYGKNIIHGNKVDMGLYASDHLLDGGLISDQSIML